MVECAIREALEETGMHLKHDPERGAVGPQPCCRVITNQHCATDCSSAPIFDQAELILCLYMLQRMQQSRLWEACQTCLRCQHPMQQQTSSHMKTLGASHSITLLLRYCITGLLPNAAELCAGMNA